YAVAFHPSGKLVAAAGGDGIVRLIDADTGALVKQFSPAPASVAPSDKTSRPAVATRPLEPLPSESLPPNATIAQLTVQPSSITLNDSGDYVQLLVNGQLESGESVDVTRLVKAESPDAVVKVAASGLVLPQGDGQGQIKLTLDGKT